ncbi:MAG TPA: hypothetical protein VK860_08375 [Ilumatobacteraceae bacterium]|nr:hypothetical protein [Ilumatobacteraceae bacterium]
MRRALALGLAATAWLTACAGDDDAADVRAAPVVVVPNEVLADLVRRVSCVEEIDVAITPAPEGVEPVLVVTLDEEPDANADVLNVSVPAVATTIDRPGPDDPWVWLDPIRFAEVAQGVGGALTLTERFDAELIDRCLARIDAEMVQLDEELYALTQTLSDEERSIDATASGVAYFATRYEFLIDESDTSVRAGDIISSDQLDGAESYDEMMLVNVERAVEVLGSR